MFALLDHSEVVFWANLVPKTEVLQINPNLVQAGVHWAIPEKIQTGGRS